MNGKTDQSQGRSDIVVQLQAALEQADALREKHVRVGIMLMNYLYDRVLGNPAADVTVIPTVLICRMIAQGANIQRNELKQTHALSGIVNDVAVFSYHEVVLFELTIMTRYDDISFKMVRWYEVEDTPFNESIILFEDRLRLCKGHRA